jgi:two-component system cell cycle response regulator DivK
LDRIAFRWKLLTVKCRTVEVTKWLKEDPELKVIPVVAVTAFAMKGDEERIREGGCEAYLSKPIPVPEFIETSAVFWGTA